MKKILFSIILFSCTFCYFSCEDVLDKKDLSAITDKDVWTDVNLATAFVNNIYLEIPSWDVTYSDACEEASRKNYWNNGATTIDNGGPVYWPYTGIRNMNQFLKDINGPLSTIQESDRKILSGQTRFVRAYLYFEMIKRYGGVPLITVPQTRNEDLYTKRSSTKDCFDFVLKELSDASGNLPDKYSNTNDLGRITKGAALALRARVWLFRASPQFNPNNTVALWDSAYIANKTAMEYLKSQGAGLVDKYTNQDLFLNEMNKEVVFAIRYLYGARTHNRDAAIRPIDFAANASRGSNPIQEMVDAYPLKSGKKTTWNDPVYGGDATKSWQNRDDRFYASIVYNGVTYLGTTMQLNADAINGYGYGKEQATLTGYYCRKASDESLTITTCQTSGVDFIDIRFAEVMMNYAEAACELGKLSEAFDVLKTIRKRAGINETTPEDSELAGKVYGLDPNMNQSQMRQAIRDERFVEFAFEQKRLWDLRRWMIMDKVMVGQNKRHALALNVSAGAPGGYTYTLIDKDDSPMIYNTNMYFLPLNTETMQGNPNLEQTKGWGNGTFDPQEGL